MRTLIAGVIVLLAWAGGPAVAATLAEIGDAGDLPGTAQSSAGVQPFGTPLDSITGTIGPDPDQDMFEIFINDPVNFSASTNNAGTNLTPNTDTMLFLFYANGLGVLANDDDPSAETFPANIKSHIPAGSLNTPAGIYFIAVSIWYNTPHSDDGHIFEDPIDMILSTVPDGPGRFRPVTSWRNSTEPDYLGTGPYRIDLTGATFVPEPSSILLLGLGAMGLAATRRRRQGDATSPHS